MSVKKDQAISLRKEGKSYREISALTGIAQSTLSFWFRNETWSKEIGETLRAQNTQKGILELKKFSRARGFALQFHYEKGKAEAVKEFTHLKKNPLFISAMSLYWGEGDKASRYNCRLTNTDPKMILIFQRFLTELCNIPSEKIRYWLLLYPDLDENTCKAYWTHEAKIPLQSFTKSIYVKGKTSEKRVLYGVGTIVHSSRYLKEKLLVWTRLLAEELSSPGENKSSTIGSKKRV